MEPSIFLGSGRILISIEESRMKYVAIIKYILFHSETLQHHLDNEVISVIKTVENMKARLHEDASEVG